MNDPDTARVLGLFAGTSVGPRDPDRELAEVLSGLNPTDRDGIAAALAGMVHDADID